MISKEVTETDSNAAKFSEQIEQGLRNFRGSVIELLSSVGADPSSPQDVARRLGINKNLAWKVSKIVNATDALSSAQHLPGTAGFEILLKALERCGAPASAVQDTRSAMADFDRLVEVHIGDRATLDLVLSNMLPERREAGRKLAYQGNSSTWGIQAKVRFGTYFDAPNREREDMIDSAVIGGLVGFRRLRADVSWPLVRQLSYQDDGTLLNDAPRPIEPDAAGATGVPLMRRFCSQPLPDIRAVESSQGTQYEICEGPIGNTATATWVFGWWTPAFASCYRDSENRFGEHTTHLFTPAELSICDLLVHRSLPVRLPPEPFLYSRLTGGPEYPAMGRDRNRLPLAEEVLDLGRTPPVVATPHIPRYPQMIEAVCERCGWKLEDFQGYRLMVRYPPIPTVAVLRFELPERS